MQQSALLSCDPSMTSLSVGLVPIVAELPVEVFVALLAEDPVVP
jgi:hypothetical protein